MTITAYAIAKQLNNTLAELEIDKSVPSQMLYTYAKKGMINGQKNCKAFTQAEADAFVQNYLVRNNFITTTTTDEVEKAVEAEAEAQLSE